MRDGRHLDRLLGGDPALMRWDNYLSWSPERLIARLSVIQSDIATLHGELAFARQREVETKSYAWQNSTEGTVTGRERDARLAATPHTITILDLEGKRAVLEEEKSFLLTLERRWALVNIRS